MIKNYSRKLGVIDHAGQASIHAVKHPPFTFEKWRDDPVDLSLAGSLVERQRDGVSFYCPQNVPEFLEGFDRSAISDAIKETDVTFPKYVENLVAFGHVTQAYAKKAVARRSEFIFLSGAAIPRDEVMAYLDSIAPEIPEPPSQPKETKRSEFVAPDGSSLAVDVEKIRSVTGYSFSPYIHHRGGRVFIPWKKRFLESNAKLLMPITCRQAGKTYDTAEMCVEESWKPERSIMVVSISVQSTKNLMKYFRRFIRDFGDVFSESKQDRTFVNTKTNTEILFAPAGTMEHAENLRGKTVDLLVIDEAWLLPDGIWDEVLKPTLIVREGRCVMLTTMRKERNWFFKLLAEVKKGEHPDAETFTVPYWDNPFYPQSEMDSIRAKEHLPHVKREYLCQYDAGDGSAFELSRSVMPDLSSCAFVVGYDPARVHDRAGVTVLAATKSGVAVSVSSHAIPDQFKGTWQLQREYVAKLRASLPGPSKLVGDVTGVGDGVAEVFEMGGQRFDLKVRYVAGAGNNREGREARVGKSHLVGLFRDNCESGDFSVFEPACFDLVEECGFASPKRLASGAETFESSFFDDVINSAMLAVYGWRELRVRGVDNNSQTDIVASYVPKPAPKGNLV